jgi:hypothetical protein
LVPLVALLGCRHGGSGASKGGEEFPGYPSPPIDVLVGEAGSKQLPPSPGVLANGGTTLFQIAAVQASLAAVEQIANLVLSRL